MALEDLLKSCDTFVVLPPNTAKGCIVFGKNSDRPEGEVQEVIYVPAQDHEAGSKLECTYIEIDQVDHTHAIILSKPAWMWGAEMGANEHGVCIGNEAVWSKVEAEKEEHLLGMDFVRLGLERATSAREAVMVITELLEKHGQGGPCSDIVTSMTYHNSYLIADGLEAWVLETVGKVWAAEIISSGFRNISNCLSIRTKIDLMSDGLLKHAESNGFWEPSSGDFDFAKAYGDGSCGDGRYAYGKKLLEDLSSSGEFDTTSMFAVLRHKESGICRGTADDNKNPTVASQVSVIAPSGSTRPSVHWFTGTPDPFHSVFKPFVFCPNVRISKHIISPTFSKEEDPAKVIPRFRSRVDRRHNLYRHHEKAYALMTSSDPKGEELRNTMRSLEATCVRDTEAFLDDFTEDSAKEVEDLLKDVIESEIKFYK